jgi:signal transduction histidine kinase
VGVVVILSDAGSQHVLDEQLERIERLASIGTLAAGLAHEIKNALVAGKTFIELLLEKNRDADLAQVVRREMERIDAIVSQMLKFGGMARHAHAAVRLHEILDHSLRLVKPQLKGKAISLSQIFRAEPDMVVGDDFQLQQVFVNLFLNALEAMEPHGTLTVATETIPRRPPRGTRAGNGGARQLRVTIKDTGTGIPAEIKERLFEPFFTTKESGTGLGLPITRRIIREHHGDIDFQYRVADGESTRDGQTTDGRPSSPKWRRLKRFRGFKAVNNSTRSGVFQAQIIKVESSFHIGIAHKAEPVQLFPKRIARQSRELSHRLVGEGHG